MGFLDFLKSDPAKKAARQERRTNRSERDGSPIWGVIGEGLGLVGDLFGTVDDGTESQDEFNDNYLAPERENNTTTIVLVVAGVLVAGVIAYFLFKPKSK